MEMNLMKRGKIRLMDLVFQVFWKNIHLKCTKLLNSFRTAWFENCVFVCISQGGDLFDAITSSTKYTERDASAMVYNLTGALKYLHRMSIVHRDIKPENLLVHTCIHTRTNLLAHTTDTINTQYVGNEQKTHHT